MANFANTISIDAAIDALGNFIQPFVGSATIIRGQVNRVAMPQSPFVVLTEILQVDLQTPWQDYQGANDPNGAATIHGDTRLDVQVDCYGANAGEMANSIQVAIRTIYAFDNFPPTVKPLYTSDAKQSPLTTAEQQYETRWTLTVSLQVAPSIQVPQQSAISASVKQPIGQADSFFVPPVPPSNPPD